MNVNDLVQERIAAARARAEEAKRRRATLAAARQRGLAFRHAAKLRNLSRGDTPTTPDRGDTPTVAEDSASSATANRSDMSTVATPSTGAATVVQATTVARSPKDLTTVTEADTVDDVVIEVTSEEWHASAAAALARLGLTYAELEDQARRRDFSTAQAHSLWVSIGGTIDTALLEETP